MIMSAEQATEIALAINLVIKLAAQDQSSILEVIADYFTLPSLMMSPPPPPSLLKIILMRWMTMMVTVVVLLLQTWLAGP